MILNIMTLNLTVLKKNNLIDNNYYEYVFRFCWACSFRNSLITNAIFFVHKNKLEVIELSTMSISQHDLNSKINQNANY